MSKKIFIQDWLELKPYEKQTITDSYYLKLSNNVKGALMKEKSYFSDLIDEKEINTLACFLTSYFEDIISGTNIWNAFVRKHKQLYQKPIPFFEVEEYFEEEINMVDIHFLIWYFVSTLREESIILPDAPPLEIMAGSVMDLFEEAWDYAPENKQLQSFYQIDVNESNFYIVRKFIDKVLFDTYLFHTDTRKKLTGKESEILKNYNQQDERKTLMLLNDMRDNMLHRTRTQLLALTGKEWAAELLCSTHPLYKDILSMSKKINGWFFYKGQDESDIFLEHVASNMKFKMTKKSYDRTENLKKIDDMLHIGIVRWKDEWWFSGVVIYRDFDADLILDEKDSIHSRESVAFLYHQSDEMKEMLDKQLDSFLKFNKGMQIAFMPVGEVSSFLKNSVDFYNNSLNLSEKEIEEAHARSRKDGLLSKHEINLPPSTENDETALVFFNPKSGSEIQYGVNSAFPLPNNPYFDKKLSEEHFTYILTDNDVSSDLAMFCIDNCKSKLPFFKQKNDITLFMKDLDFMLRFWKGENYFQEPRITMT